MSNIKWRKKDVEKVKKLVKSYNSKIKRLADKGYDKDLLPEKTTYNEVKNKIKNREDFNTETKLLEAFTRKYSEKTWTKTTRGANIPYFIKDTEKIKRDVVNKKRKEQRKKYENIPKTDRNRPIDKANNNFGNQNLSELNPRNFNYENKSKKELLLHMESLKNYNQTYSEKNRLYVANFYQSLYNTLSAQQFDKIVKVLDKLSIDEIVQKYYTDENMRISFHYEPSDQDLKYDEIFDAWKSMLENDVNKITKNRR